MFEPTQRRVDSDLEKSMDLFRRAEVGEVAPLEPIKPQRILLALDGSAQDALSISMTQRLKARLGCEVTVVDARETGTDQKDLAAEASKQVSGQAIDRAQFEDQLPAYDRILLAIEQSQANLAVAPCPFGRDLECVGADSTGTVIDVLLARSAVPIIITRGRFDVGVDIFSRVRLILSGENRTAPLAARWAQGVVAPGGKLELMLLVETEFYDNVREALHALHPEEEIKIGSLETALAKIHARLHASLQASADQHGFDYEELIEHEGEEEPFDVDESAGYVVTLAIEARDHASQSHAHDLIRRSPHPVLLVPQPAT
ncbi:MAG: universal stress protein [Pirellulales bacterium]|nr:universal stress protein [Pirellulales bacterium]